MGSKPVLFNGDGKVVVVVGAANGIGRAIMNMCLDAGARILAADLLPIAEGPAVKTFIGDVSLDGIAGQLAGRAYDVFGRIDAVVNCVGVAGNGPIDDVRREDWDRVMAINLTASVLLAQAFHQYLKDSEGNFVLFSSTAGRNGGTIGTGAVYAASKAGVISLARYLAKEWARDKIRVNTILPALVRTGPSQAMSQERIERFLDTMLTARFIEPEEIAAAVLFLLSDHARSMTGAVMNLSGGLCLD